MHKICFTISLFQAWFQTFAVIWIFNMFFWVFPRRQIVVGRRFGTLYWFHLQRLVVDCEVWEEVRCNIYPARVVNWGWPGQWGSKATSSGRFKVGRSGQPQLTTLAGYILHLASSHTSQSTTSHWRWNRYRVPKRRPTTIWRRGNTQKNIFNIQITAKVWNQGQIGSMEDR